MPSRRSQTPSLSRLPAGDELPEPCRHRADGDQDDGHPQAEGKQQGEAEREPSDRLGQDDQPDGVPARHQPPRDAQPDHAPRAEVGRAAWSLAVVLAEAGQVAAQSPEPDRRDQETRGVRQADVDRPRTATSWPTRARPRRAPRSRCASGSSSRPAARRGARSPARRRPRRPPASCRALAGSRATAPRPKAIRDQSRAARPPRRGRAAARAGRIARPATRRDTAAGARTLEASGSPARAGAGCRARKETSTCLVRRSSASLSCQTGRIGDEVDVGGQVVPLDRHALPAPDGEAAGPLARREVGVADRQPPARRQRDLVVEHVAWVLLDGQVEAPAAEVERSAVHRDEQPLGVQRAGLAPVAVEPVAAVGPGQVADQRPEVLRQRQLGQADLVVDRQSAGCEGRLDRAIDPGVGDVVRPGRRAAPPEDQEQLRREPADAVRPTRRGRRPLNRTSRAPW